MRFAPRHVAAVLCVATLVFVLAGCEEAALPSTVATPTAGSGSFSVEIHGASGGSVTPAADWPKTAPSIIPGYPGHLDSIAADRPQSANGLYSVRMSFSGVAVPDFWTYLAKLRGDGFSTRGVVFVAPGQSEADAESRAGRGEFDAVQAFRPPFRITVTVPAGSKMQSTLDLEGLTKDQSDAIPALNDTAGSGGPESAAPAAGAWPADWVDRVAAPSGCSVEAAGIKTNTHSTLVVSCVYPDADAQHHQTVATGYADALVASGFAKTGETTTGAKVPGGLARIQLTKGSLQVSIEIEGASNAMLISVVDMGA